jgi:signal transduction histidine kinase/ActR/RegA family two-component response regulator
MSGRFSRLPIRYKVVTTIMMTAAAMLLLAGVGYLVSDYYRTRVELRSEVEAQAQLVLLAAQAALQFQQPEPARETLDGLAVNRHIRIACLYDADRRLFVEFTPHADAGGCLPQSPAEGYLYSANRLDLTVVGRTDDRPFGSLMLRTDLAPLTARVRDQAIIVAILLIMTLGVAVLVSARVQAVLSDPVIELARTASDVSARGDYSVRARRRTEDELGLLADAFNGMLERIQLRERELSAANEELRREVAERRRAEQERAEMLVREREANRLKDEFLATLSHELRTPLNAILGWTRLLRAQAVPAASFDKALEKVERNAQAQTRLVEDLLEISRITTGKLTLEQRPFDLVALCRTAIDSIRPTAEARGVTIDPRFETMVMPTAGDPDRLQQVMWNLLSNAVKFTPAGGAVTVTLRRIGAHDQIVVSDTGIGIEPSFLPNVFDTFRQADASSTRSHGGLGLGLSIVKRLVELHGGEVRAASEGAGTGATFTVRLPVAQADRPRPPIDAIAPVPVPEGRLAGTRILVVDDDHDTRDLLVSVLEAAGAVVRPAASAAEAVTMAVDEPPDAIVSDIAMPEADGYGLLRQLLAALGPRAPRVRVAVSAYGGVADRDRSVEAGFQRHLPKPIDPVGLVTILEQLLEGDMPEPHARSNRS